MADFLGLKSTKMFAILSVRGLTSYPNGHAFDCEFIRMRRGKISVGRAPITDKLVFWFVALPWTPSGEIFHFSFKVKDLYKHNLTNSSEFVIAVHHFYL